MRHSLAGLLLLLVSIPALAGTIVVDTGHTPRSTGSTASDGTPEFEINRGLATALIDALLSKGHHVVDVHGAGFDKKLLDRAKPTVNADLFISIHHDSIHQSLIDEGRANEFSGFSVFVSTKNRWLRGSLKCAIHVGEAMTRGGEKPSLFHADDIPGEGKQLLDDRRGIHRYDNLLVLRSAKSPAILLEAGVIVNPYEVGKLTSKSWQASMAEEIAVGITTCVEP